MEGLRILSFNVNGIGDYHKRKDIFDYLKKIKCTYISDTRNTFKDAAKKTMWEQCGGIIVF